MQVSGTLQQHQSQVLSGLLDGRSSVRREALAVVKMLIDQGLAHPMSCIPHVMALEVDVLSADGVLCAPVRSRARSYSRRYWTTLHSTRYTLLVFSSVGSRLPRSSRTASSLTEI